MGGALKAIGGIAKKALPAVAGMMGGGGKDEKGGGGGGFGGLLKTGLGMLGSKDEDGVSGFEKAGGFIGNLFGKEDMGKQIGGIGSSIFDMFSGPQEEAA